MVGLGGFLGTIGRYLVLRYFQLNFETAFPWGTLVVNIGGSFLIGIFYGLSERSHIMPAEWRLFLTVGLCGGFTTFSTVSNDAFILLQGKEILRMASYIGFSFFLGILAVFMGRTLIKII